MLRLFYILIHGCDHVWEEYSIVDLLEDEWDEIPSGKVVYSKCKKCGRHIKFKLI